MSAEPNELNEPEISDVSNAEIPSGRFWRWAFITEGFLVVLAILLG